MSVAFLNQWTEKRLDFFKWRVKQGVLVMITMSLAMACLTGLAAQLKFYLPFTPVPVTGQTFAVLLAGVILGRNWGGISQIFYLGFGFLGVPWFAASTGTIGYLIGFVLAAFFLGYVSDKYIRSRNFLNMFGLMVFATLFLIYVPGLVYLGFYLSMVKGSFPGVIELLWLGAIPFLPGALVKTVLAAAAAKALTPKKSFAQEVDA